MKNTVTFLFLCVRVSQRKQKLKSLSSFLFPRLLLAAPNHPLSCSINNKGIREQRGGWRDGSAGKSIYYSSGDPHFSSQHSRVATTVC